MTPSPRILAVLVTAAILLWGCGEDAEAPQAETNAQTTDRAEVELSGSSRLFGFDETSVHDEAAAIVIGTVTDESEVRRLDLREGHGDSLFQVITESTVDVDQVITGPVDTGTLVVGEQYGWLETPAGERTYQVSGGSRLDVGDHALIVLFRSKDDLYFLFDSYIELADERGVPTERHESELLTELETMPTEQMIDRLEQICGSDGCRLQGFSGHRNN